MERQAEYQICFTFQVKLTEKNLAIHHLDKKKVLCIGIDGNDIEETGKKKGLCQDVEDTIWLLSTQGTDACNNFFCSG